MVRGAASVFSATAGSSWETHIQGHDSIASVGDNFIKPISRGTFRPVDEGVAEAWRRCRGCWHTFCSHPILSTIEEVAGQQVLRSVEMETIAMNRLRIASGLLAALSGCGLARAQTSGSDRAPVAPPPPGRVESPAAGRAGDRSQADRGRTAGPARAKTSRRCGYFRGQPRRPSSQSAAPAGRPGACTQGAAGSDRRASLGHADPSHGPSGCQATGTRTPRGREFVWMGGVWQVPPCRSIWVASRWMRDGDGWYRRPGFWSRRRDGVVATSTTEPNDRQPAWRTTGPPANHPPTLWPTHPGLTIFLVPGHYAPDGDRLRWKPVFLDACASRLGLDPRAVGSTGIGMGVPCGPLGAGTGGR